MGEKTMPVTGGCLCGAVRYKISADPEYAGYCHCRQCRKQSGAPVTVAVLFPLEAVEWTDGEPAVYRSSSKAIRRFCANCGSSLTWETPSSFTVFIGTLDRPEEIRLHSHVYTETQLPWLEIKDELRRHPAHDDVQWPADDGYNPTTGAYRDAN